MHNLTRRSLRTRSSRSLRTRPRISGISSAARRPGSLRISSIPSISTITSPGVLAVPSITPLTSSPAGNGSNTSCPSFSTLPPIGFTTSRTAISSTTTNSSDAAIATVATLHPLFSRRPAGAARSSRSPAAAIPSTPGHSVAAATSHAPYPHRISTVSPIPVLRASIASVTGNRTCPRHIPARSTIAARARISTSASVSAVSPTITPITSVATVKAAVSAVATVAEIATVPAIAAVPIRFRLSTLTA
jgi:hypothetical protein